MGLETLAFDAIAGEVLGGEIVGAATDALGSEFLSADVFAETTTIFDSAAPTLSELSGSAYQEVGSFAGNSEWVNTFQPGSIVDAAQVVVDDAGIPLLSADVTAINNGSLTPSLFDSAYASVADFGSSLTNSVSDTVNNLTGYSGASPTEAVGNPIGAAQIVVDDSGVPLLPADVTTINNGSLTPSLFDTAYAKAADIVSATGIQNQAKNVAVGYVSQSTGVPPQLINYAGSQAITGYPSAATGYNGTYVGTPGFVSGDGGYPGTTSVSSNYQEVFNSVTGTWDVRNTTTNQTVASGLTQQAAILSAQDFNVTQPAITLNTGPTGQVQPGAAFDLLGNLNPGFILGTGGVPVFVGTTLASATNTTSTAAGTVQALVQQAQQQQTIRDQRQTKAQSTDWRVRLRLAPQSNYLYNDPNCGPVLWPLHVTDGVIFPYTPSIDIGYKANYDAYDLTHSNYRGYFYKGSYIDAVNIRATFTAQDTNEANYLLAVIHFFRSVTKMFYGQDAQRGSPPPLTYLSGLGDFQFNEHPCLVQQFNYNLPADVDYIRAQSTTSNGTNLLQSRTRQSVNSLFYGLTRLASVGLPKGALTGAVGGSTLGAGNATYVPTKMDINLTLLPIQSRSQVSQQFSLRNFANGNLLKGGFW